MSIFDQTSESVGMVANIQMHKGDRVHVDLNRISTRRKVETIDDDIHRLMVSLITVLKRKYPNDYKRMLAEMVV